jgi:hypothetical protein
MIISLFHGFINTGVLCWLQAIADNNSKLLNTDVNHAAVMIRVIRAWCS